MSITSHHAAPRRKSHAGLRGLTLIEMMITMAIFGFAIAALMSAFLFGMRADQLAQSKLGASDESRRTFERVARDIRSANSHSVGNYDTGAGTFTPITNGTNLLSGNALRIFLLSDTSTNITYYFDTNGPSGTWTLKRRHTGDAGPIVIATNLQNSCTFSIENYYGIVQTGVDNKDVVHFMLDFCEYQYPLTHVGTNGGCFYDRYVLDFRAAPHVPGGK